MPEAETRRPRAVSWMVLLLLAGAWNPLAADLCTVPGSHPSVQSAVADTTCTEVVLSPLTFKEGSISIGRDLVLRGGSSANTTIEGRLHIHGSTTQAAVRNLTIDAGAAGVAGCYDEALLVEGAELAPMDVVAKNGTAVCAMGLLFADGFESGDRSNWSSSSP